MEKTIKGKIVSKELGKFSKREIVYGNIGIETLDGQKVVVKLDAYTWYETLEIGRDVIVEIDSLGSTDIIVARKISVDEQTLTKLDEPVPAST